MDVIIQNAYRGKRSAINTLFNENKDKVYALAFCLLNDNKKAEKVVSDIFSKIWTEFKTAGISTEKEFSDVCINKTILECKKIILKEDSKAFQPPKNKNFSINSQAVIQDGSLWKEAVSPLSKLQKFAYIILILCNYNPPQIAKICNVDTGSIELALGAAHLFFEKTYGSSKVGEGLFNFAQNTVFSSEDVGAILNGIDDYVVPFEKAALVSKIRTATIILVVTFIVAVAVVLGIVISNSDDYTDTSKVSSESTVSMEEKWLNSVEATDYAVIDIKDYGIIHVALDAKSAPITVANFKKLATEGFYDGLTFHRIMKGFMMQGGDPDANGTGGSDEEIKGEFYANGVANDIGHFRGAISMARGTPMNSASSQFFIVHEDSEFLNGKYAAFGFVVKGIEVVDKVCKNAKPTDNNGTIPYKEQPVINSIKIYTVEEYKQLTSDESSESTDASEATSEEASSVDTSTENSEATSEESTEGEQSNVEASDEIVSKENE